jgi:hypothetical protein
VRKCAEEGRRQEAGDRKKVRSTQGAVRRKGEKSDNDFLELDIDGT